MAFRITQIISWIGKRLPPRYRRGPSGGTPGKNDDTAGESERKLVTALAKSRLPNFRQLRYLPRVLSPEERFLLRLFTGTLAVTLIFLGARLYAKNVVLLPRPGGEVVEALVGTPQYLNPVLASTNDIDRDLIRLLYAGLMRRNERQEIVPDLAETVEISPDKKVYTVRLRPNLDWSDGEPLTVDDVLLTFELIQDSLYKSPIRSQFRNVKVERVDDTTVKFTLAEPSAAFLSRLTVGILPAHIWGDVPPPSFALIEFNVKPVGAGPFVFDSLKRDSSSGIIKEYHLIRNDRYRGKRPYLDRLTFKIFPEIDSAAAALKSKQVEGLSVITSDIRSELKQVRTVELQVPQYTAIFFNGKRPLLKDLELRRTLTRAIDRPRIIATVLDHMATLVDGPFPSNFPGSAGKLQPDFDPAAAREALEKSGWTLTEGQRARKKGNDELSLSLTVVDQPDDIAMAEIVKENWGAVGVKVEIKAFDPSRIAKEVIKPRDFDALLYGEILPPDGDLYAFWHSSQERDPGLNLTTFYHKDADKLLEELRTTNDPTQQAEKRIAFQKLLADGAAAAFLYSPLYSYGLAKRVKGFTATYVTIPADRFAGIEEWYVKTRLALK